MTRRVQSFLILAVSAAISSVFIINLCATIFQCGCTWVWAGAATHCNIHAASGRHCPWCVIGNDGFAVVLGFIVAAQAIAAFRLPLDWPARLLATLAVFPLVGAIEALVVGLWKGYWN